MWITQDQMNDVSTLVQVMIWCSQLKIIIWTQVLITIGSSNGLSPIWPQSITLKQCWLFANWSFRNKRKWNLNRNYIPNISYKRWYSKILSVNIISPGFNKPSSMVPEISLTKWTRRSENDDTPQPLDQWTNSPFIGQQVGNWSICHALWPIRKPIVHPRLYPTHISFIPSQSKFPFLKYGY